jgi:aconitate hydratase
VQNPPFFEGMAGADAHRGHEGRPRPGLFGDSITTDHISPAGSIKADSPAGSYLQEHGVPVDFNSYGSRRGNHEVMMRGTFANIRIKNQMLRRASKAATPSTTRTASRCSIYDAAMKYKRRRQRRWCIFAGKEYGTGSSRDWACQGHH